MMIERFNKETGDHKNKYRLKSLKTRKGRGSKGKGVHAGADDDASTGAGGGGASVADSKDLGAHGYEVKLDVSMIRVAHSSRSSRCGDHFVLIIHCADARPLDAAEYPHCLSTVGPGQAADCEESLRVIERA